MLNINLKNKVEVLNEENYKFYKNITHTGTIIFPDYESLLFQTLFSDGLGRHDIGGLYFTILCSTIDSLWIKLS